MVSCLAPFWVAGQWPSRALLLHLCLFGEIVCWLWWWRLSAVGGLARDMTAVRAVRGDVDASVHLVGGGRDRSSSLRGLSCRHRWVRQRRLVVRHLARRLSRRSVPWLMQQCALFSRACAACDLRDGTQGPRQFSSKTCGWAENLSARGASPENREEMKKRRRIRGLCALT